MLPSTHPRKARQGKTAMEEKKRKITEENRKGARAHYAAAVLSPRRGAFRVSTNAAVPARSIGACRAAGRTFV
jgi:hypothetical protein